MTMQDPAIILATINARYTHPAFGLRCLWANLGPLQDLAVIHEFTLGQPSLEIAESVMAQNPRIIGFGVYIWNVFQITQVVQVLKAVRPEITVVLGGPEVAYEYEGTPLFEAADYLIRGEGDEAFAALASEVLAGNVPSEKVLAAEPPDVARLPLPYAVYTEEDLARRLTYVESSRGCPFQCEFCLSSLDTRVREFPLEPFLASMAQLLDRGARRIKFVDRTFNLRPERVARILDFFLGHWREGMQVHFEILPDRLTRDMLAQIAEFPPEGLRLEVGVQTFNAECQEVIGRKQDLEKTQEYLAFLRSQTDALIHADLIAGLPGESWESFREGFDKLLRLAPHEIQVGILKRLKGAPIARHAASRRMAFNPQPPYDVLQTDLLSFEQLQRLKRFARYFDLYYNSGNFPRSLPLLWRTQPSPFNAFMALSDDLWSKTGRTHHLPLVG